MTEQKLRHLEVTDELSEKILSLLEKIPELRSCAVVLDWNVAQNDFPYGLMIGRQGSVRLPGELHSLMIQTAKLSKHQADVMLEILANVDKMAEDLKNKITTLKEEIGQLESSKAALTQKN